MRYSGAYADFESLIGWLPSSLWQWRTPTYEPRKPLTKACDTWYFVLAGKQTT